MKKIAMSLFIYVITISALWAESEIIIRQNHGSEETDRSIAMVSK